MSTIRKQFILTINSFADINFNHTDIDFFQQLNCNGIEVDAKIFDELCQNTITYCYEAIRASGELIRTNTRNNLSLLIGDYLFKILLKNPIGNELVKSINENDKKNDHEKEDLQLILKFGDSDDAAILAKCPWEYLHYSNELDIKKGFFLLSKIKLHRVYDKPSSGLETLKKLNVLVFFSPQKGQFEKKHIEEIEQLFRDIKAAEIDNNKGLKESLFSYLYIAPPENENDINPKTTYDNFYNAVSQHKPDIVHFIGEAKIEGKGDEAQLFFWQQDGLSVDAKGVNLSDRFYPEFEKAITSLGIKFFIFQSWNNYEDGAYLGFKNIAAKLIEYHLPAVLSIPYSFNLAGTNNLAIYKDNISKFYKSLMDGSKSLSDAIFILQNSLSRAGKGYPIIYSGSSDIDSFKIQKIAENREGQETFNPSTGVSTGNTGRISAGTVGTVTGNNTSPSQTVDEKSINHQKKAIEMLVTRINEIEMNLPMDNNAKFTTDKGTLEKNMEIIVENLKNLYDFKNELGKKHSIDLSKTIKKIFDDRIDALFAELQNKQGEIIGNNGDPEKVTIFINDKINLYKDFLQRI
ncbi:MAG: hypothetical protein H7Z13_00600 [Ferruginibacter sp.]|nr:hypothetical protein [Ferruginibacter sp.]